MAVGDGGFSTKPMGFDKNEVNEYISNLRKRMNELEADMKANNEKTEAAQKLAAEADQRIQAAVAEAQGKTDELSRQLKGERDYSEKLKKQIDDLKKKLDEEKKKMTDMLKSGKGVDAEAKRAYAEVIDKANADAKEITDKATAAANEIISAAEQHRAEIEERLAEFMTVLRGQIDTINDGYKSVNDSAAALLGAKAAPLPAAPVFTAPAAPVEEQPAPAAEEPVKVNEPAPQEEASPAAEATDTAEEPDAANEPDSSADDAALLEAIMAMEAQSAPQNTAEPEAEESDSGDMLADFGGEWGGIEVAESIANDEKKEKVPLMNPDAPKDLFGNDLFNSDSSDDDMSGSFDTEETIDEIEPLDNSHHAKASFDSSFTNELISQTMTSANLGDDADEDLLAAIRAQEEKFAVKPNDVSVGDLDMDEHEDAPSDEDALMNALREAEEALNNMGGSKMDDSASEDTSGSNPWDDLQKQLEEMEKAGNFGDLSFDTPEPEPNQAAAAPAAETPSADDASIWDFGMGGETESSDDDMSGDMFGGFGGF